MDSRAAIANLIARYAELVDDGDFAGVGELFAEGTFAGSAGAVTGRDAVERMLRGSVITYDDGTPRTQHVTTNLQIEVDDAAGTASARSYVTVLQALPDLPFQLIVAGRYRDEFVYREGKWCFRERQVRITHVGDVSRHLTASAQGGDDLR